MTEMHWTVTEEKLRFGATMNYVNFLYSWSRLLLISILAVKMVMHDIENPLKTLFELQAICGKT